MTVALKFVHSVHRGAKVYYNLLTQSSNLPNCCAKWSEKYEDEIIWKTVFLKIHKIGQVKLKWLQMRIVHRILATNVVLEKMKIAANAKCTFCSVHNDSIQHMFWECERIRCFWNRVESLLKEKCQVAVDVRFTEKLVLFGYENNVQMDTVFDFILLAAKSFIYRCKMNKCIPYVSAFRKQLNSMYKVEELSAKMNFEIQKFQRNWCFYTPFLED